MYRYVALSNMAAASWRQKEQQKLSLSRGKVIKLAVKSRLGILILQAFFNFIIPDHNADAFRKPKTEAVSRTDEAFQSIFSGLEPWDGQHFLHVAQYGYSYESSTAFFPLFPLLVRTFSDLTLRLCGFLNIHNCLLASAVIVNFICFVIAAVALYDLTLTVTKNEKFSYNAARLFCVNPASIFFTAAYSEALFAALTFLGILHYLRANPFKSTLYFALSVLTRSNGLLLAGFPAFLTLKTFLASRWNLFKIAGYALSVTVIVSPFAVYQLYVYNVFCGVHDWEYDTAVVAKAATDNLKLAGLSVSPWCRNTLPVAYSYVQNYYWDVGLFKYYRWKQIPNFVLAAPMAMLCGFGFVRFAKHFAKCCQAALKRAVRVPVNCWCWVRLPFVIHALVLLVVGVTTAHVQVLTRMMASSSPVVYWFAAEYAASGSPKRRTICEKYFLAYAVIGAAMFPNFLPWT